VNSDTAVWLDRKQEQDNRCESPTGKPTSLRLAQVHVSVFEDDTMNCDRYLQTQTSNSFEDENGVIPAGEQVLVLLKQVLVGGVNLTLAAGGSAMTQTVELDPQEVFLYVKDGSDKLLQRWQRSGIGNRK